MALSTLFPLATLFLLSIFIFAVEADLAPSPTPSPTPTPLLDLAPSPTPTPLLDVSSLSIATQQSLLPQVESQLSVAVPHDKKAQMTKVIESNMKMTMKKIEDFGRTLKKRLNDPETSKSTKECIQQCDEVYASAVDDIRNSLEDINGGDLFKANFDINAISTNVDTCQQCFEEMVGEDAELTKFDNWVRGVTDNCLDALDKVVT